MSKDIKNETLYMVAFLQEFYDSQDLSLFLAFCQLTCINFVEVFKWMNAEIKRCLQNGTEVPNFVDMTESALKYAVKG
jgi:hypothetical protein